MADYIVIQISIENLDGSEVTNDQLINANSCLNECCHKLEKLKVGYISAELYNGSEVVNLKEI